MSEVWSAIMVRDVIYNMAEFAAHTCEGWDNNEDWDYTTENPEITDAEMEQIVPGDHPADYKDRRHTHPVRPDVPRHLRPGPRTRPDRRQRNGPGRHTSTRQCRQEEGP